MIKISDVTPENINNFIQGNLNYYLGNNPPHYIEQFLYRAYLCSECLQNGKCLHCGCTTPNMFFSPRKIDSMDKWPPFFFKEEDWNDYKRRYSDANNFSEATERLLRSDNDRVYDGRNIAKLVFDAAAILQEHRDKDAQNPPLTLEQAEEILQSQDRLPRVSN